MATPSEAGTGFEDRELREHEIAGTERLDEGGQVSPMGHAGSACDTLSVVSAVRSRMIKDRLSPSVSGVGIIGTGIERPSDHYLYRRWANMLCRCHDQSHWQYPTYGGAGVTVCEAWLRFDRFVESAERLPGFDKARIISGELSIDKDSTGDRRYSPETCRWATRKEQAESKRTKRSWSPFAGIRWRDDGDIWEVYLRRGINEYQGRFNSHLYGAWLVNDRHPDYFTETEKQELADQLGTFLCDGEPEWSEMESTAPGDRPYCPALVIWSGVVNVERGELGLAKRRMSVALGHDLLAWNAVNGTECSADGWSA